MTAACRHPPSGSNATNTFAVPLRTYSQSYRCGTPGRGGSGTRISPTNCRLASSKHTSGRRGSAGRLYTASTSSIAATNAQSACGGMHHIFRSHGFSSFF